MDATTSRARILVVEDNDDTRLLLRHLLGRTYELALAGSVDDAIAHASRTTFDILIIDINLGEVRTGIDVLTEVRGQPSHRNVRALALTAYALPGDAERYLEAGFDAYMSKPFTSRQLFSVVRDLVGNQERGLRTQPVRSSV